MPHDSDPSDTLPLGTASSASSQSRSADIYQTALEKDFPRILVAVQAMWGYPELNIYFRKLTLDSRGDRGGFPKEVWEEIFALLYLHQVIVPEPLF